MRQPSPSRCSLLYTSRVVPGAGARRMGHHWLSLLGRLALTQELTAARVFRSVRRRAHASKMGDGHNSEHSTNTPLDSTSVSR